METTKEKLERKLKDALMKLAEAEAKYEKLLEAQRERDHYKNRVDRLTKMLSEL